MPSLACPLIFLSSIVHASKQIFVNWTRWSVALLAAGGHNSDVEVSASDENSERYRGHGTGDTGIGRMREATAGDFRCTNRFPRGRGTGGQPAGKNSVRLSVSTGMRRGQELRRCLFQFGLGLSGACHAFGPRRGSSFGIQTRDSSEASRLSGSKWYENQDSFVARFEGRLSRTLPSQGGCSYFLTLTRFYRYVDFGWLFQSRESPYFKSRYT